MTEIGQHTLTLKVQCKPHRLSINLGESCSKLLLHCTKWGFLECQIEHLRKIYTSLE